MTTIDTLRNNIVDKLLTISNKDYLSALYKLIETNSADNKKIKLSKAQISMLGLSDDDIKSGRLISQEELDKSDLKWLKEQ